jgi:hypothetical protein
MVPFELKIFGGRNISSYIQTQNEYQNKRRAYCTTGTIGNCLNIKISSGHIIALKDDNQALKVQSIIGTQPQLNFSNGIRSISNYIKQNKKLCTSHKLSLTWIIHAYLVSIQFEAKGSHSHLQSGEA